MFDWDSSNVGHIARHGVLPEEVEQVVENNPLYLERQIRNGEERIVLLGETMRARVLIVIATWREEALRIVTAFPADRQSKRLYLSQKVKKDDAKDIRDP